ncbi:MAG: protein phosphatase 2C domain-containing protein [Pseudonocardiales bacterium]|nr:protein phosphatase 2C domain-containing protein [Pseudonocardiales bacterium]
MPRDSERCPLVARPAHQPVPLQEPKGEHRFLDTGVDPALIRPPVFDGAPRAARLPWRLPTEPSQSGIAADEARLGDLDVRAVSLIGASHRCEEPATARQDTYRLGRDAAGRYLVVAVADGLSEGRRSDLGATVAARCAVDMVRKELDRGAAPDIQWLEVFRLAASTVASAAKQSELSPKEVCTALIVAIVPAEPDNRDGGRRVWFASLADVSAWQRSEAGWRMLAGDPKEDVLDRNAVHHFLPCHPDKVTVVYQDVPQGATITIVSDGVGDALADVPGASKWFARRWRTPPPLASFLLDVAYEARGQLDDRTAVTVWCGGRTERTR